MDDIITDLDLITFRVFVKDAINKFEKKLNCGLGEEFETSIKEMIKERKELLKRIESTIEKGL